MPLTRLYFGLRTQALVISNVWDFKFRCFLDVFGWFSEASFLATRAWICNGEVLAGGQSFADGRRWQL